MWRRSRSSKLIIQSQSAWDSWLSFSNINDTTAFSQWANIWVNSSWDIVVTWMEYIVVLWSNVTNNTISMVDISWLSVNLSTWRYRVEFVPFYDVNATTTWTWWNFWSWTCILNSYSFISTLPSTATASYSNFYVSRTQDFTTAQTSRTTDNRWVIIADFNVTTAWTFIPRFRSEVAWWLVTVKSWSYMIVKKIS